MYGKFNMSAQASIELRNTMYPQTDNNVKSMKNFFKILLHDTIEFADFNKC